MPEIVETAVYRLEELSGAAKEAARTWYREGCLDDEWYAFVSADFETICEILGVVLKTSSVRLFGGGWREDLARWLCQQLECEYEYRNSIEAVDEAIVANDYTFTESGHRFG